MKYFVHFSKAIFVLAGVLLLSASALIPPEAHAATKAPALEVSGWLPYWRAATSTADVLPHLNKLTEINPFGYTVKSDLTLFDPAGLNSATSTWAPLIQAARAQKVRVIPTVMWSDTNAISTMLASSTLRAKHIANIVQTVQQNNWDGIDVDYEGKRAEDKDNFSAFLKELYTAMGKKWVMCTIEARTPPQDLNTNALLSDIQYSNDFKAINKYCDRVRFMTYDQESADKTLNNANSSTVYSPVADPKWVTAAIQLAEKDISPRKIEMGVATYGYEYDVTPYSNGSGYIYDLLWSFNPGYVPQVQALQKTSAITRNPWGELSLTYVPTSTPATIPTGTSAATSTNPNLVASAATALTPAQSFALPGTFRYMTWSDSVAIAQKIALAKKLGIRGISVFKLDGGEDPTLWNILPTQR